jgi:hypothetical protein
LVSQIDRFRTGRVRHRGSGFDNALPLDQNFAGAEKFSAFDIQQPGGVQHHGLLLSEDRARR